MKQLYQLFLQLGLTIIIAINDQTGTSLSERIALTGGILSYCPTR